MSAPPWMPLYIAEYLADTGHLTTLEHGAYLLLICHYWQSGGLPDDDVKLARIARLQPKQWAAIRNTIADLFEDGWRHKRIDVELGKTSEMIGSKSRAGVQGAETRWGQTSRGKRSERLAAARQKGSHTPDEWLAMLAIFPGCVKCGIRHEDLFGGKCLRDHIVPIYQGGSDGIENIQPMCRNCNSAKGGDSTDYRTEAVPDWRIRLAECLTGPPKTPAKRLADASQTPAHLHLPSPTPYERPKKEGIGFPSANELVEMLVKAAKGNVVNGSESIEIVRPISDLIAMGCDLELDILPTIAEHVVPLESPLRTWAAGWLRKRILERHAARLKGRGATNGHAEPDWTPPADFPPDWPACIAVLRPETAYKLWRGSSWPVSWGPMPGDPGCKLPPAVVDEWMARAQQDAAA